MIDTAHTPHTTHRNGAKRAFSRRNDYEPRKSASANTALRFLAFRVRTASIFFDFRPKKQKTAERFTLVWCVVCVVCVSHTWLRGTRIRSAPDSRPSKQPDHSNRDTTHHIRRLQQLNQKSDHPGRKVPAKSGRGYHLPSGKPVFLLQFLPFYFHLSNRSGRSWRPSYRLGLLRYTSGSLRSIHGRGSWRSSGLRRLRDTAHGRTSSFLCGSRL